MVVCLRRGAKRVHILLSSTDKVKVKVPLLQATKALRAGRDIALPFLRPRH